MASVDLEFQPGMVADRLHIVYLACLGRPIRLLTRPADWPGLGHRQA